MSRILWAPTDRQTDGRTGEATLATDGHQIRAVVIHLTCTSAVPIAYCQLPTRDRQTEGQTERETQTEPQTHTQTEAEAETATAVVEAAEQGQVCRFWRPQHQLPAAAETAATSATSSATATAAAANSPPCRPPCIPPLRRVLPAPYESVLNSGRKHLTQLDSRKKRKTATASATGFHAK